MIRGQGRLLVLDASVLINVGATGFAREILEALVEHAVVVGPAHDEVRGDPRSGARTSNFLGELVEEGILTRVELSGEQAELFVDLAGAPAPDDLGDGEAATVAFGAAAGLQLALDDGKARRVSSARFPGCQLSSSIDLLRRESTRLALGADRLTTAVHDALMFARMRVMVPDFEWVIGLIGVERARGCPGLRRALKSLPISQSE